MHVVFGKFALGPSVLLAPLVVVVVVVVVDTSE